MGDDPLVVFVTVGSTQFDALIKGVLSPPFIAQLRTACRRCAVRARLIVQYGQSALQMPLGASAASLHGTPCVHAPGGDVDLYLFAYTRAFSTFLRDAHLVIAHAGTCVAAQARLTAGAGTILETLRTEPPPRLLVVPNTSLMDNHQRELADALRGAYLEVGDADALGNALEPVLSARYERFPPSDPSRFLAVVRETLAEAEPPRLSLAARVVGALT